MKYYTDTDTKTKSSKKLYLDTSMSMSFLVPYYDTREPINGPGDVGVSINYAIPPIILYLRLRLP